MKKVFTLFAALLTMGAIMAQTPTIVSTEVQKRNVLIEEFTGVNCGYCPDGHARANAICEQYEGHAWAINIHAGGYATGSGYTTPVGDGIHSEYQSEIDGYPCGVVNRGSVMDRGQWANTAATIRSQDAIVNIAGTGEVDAATRTITLHVEVYYTATSAQSTNYFNVAVLQNNILGYQSNYGNYNPDYIEGSQYRHMHMLRDLMVGQWGRPLTATEGTFFDTTIVFTVPDAINGLAVSDLSDLEFVAFVSETHRNILNAAEVIIPETTPRLSKVTAEQAGNSCSMEYSFAATIINNTEVDVTSVVLNIDGTEETYEVNIPSLTSAVIELPSYTFEVSGEAVQNCTGTKSVSLVSAVTSDGEMEINSAAKTVDYGGFNIYTVEGPFTVRAGIDAYGTEASVQLMKQSDCSEVWNEASPFGDLSTSVQYISQLPGARFMVITFSPAEAGLYILRAHDTYGDGWYMTNNSNVSGMWLNNAAGEIFSDAWGYSNGPVFTNMDYYLNVTNAGDGSHSMLDIDETVAISTSVYPNPVSDILNVEAVGLQEVVVMDLSGRTLMTVKGNKIDMSSLNAGVYMINVITDNGVAAKKIVKQ